MNETIINNNSEHERGLREYEQFIANGGKPQIIPVVQRPIKKGTINKHEPNNVIKI